MTSLVPLQESVDFAVSPFDNALASALNTRMSLVPVMNSPTFRNDLPSKLLGSQSQVNLPTNNLLSNAILTCSFTVDNTSSGLRAGSFLGEGWLFSAIDYVEYSFGTSSTLRVTGDALRIWNLSQCESGEKQKAAMRLAGQQYNTIITGTEVLPAGYAIRGSVVLPLPCSNMNSGKLIPYDLTLLSNKPASVRIRFKYGPDVITRGTTGTVPVIPTEFAEAYVSFQQEYLANGPSDSIQALVSRGGGRKYDYPFMYPQSYVSAPFEGNTEAIKTSIELRNFLPGSVQSIDFWLERLTNDGEAPPTPLNGSANNPAWFSPISNLEILYGGQIIYRADSNVQELMSLCDYPMSGAFDVQVPAYSATGAATSKIVYPKTSSWCHVQLSQFNEVFVQGGLIQTGMMLNNSTVTVRFNTPNLVDLRIDPATPIVSDPSFRLHANYNYQCSLRSAEGETSILFVRPDRLIPSV